MKYFIIYLFVLCFSLEPKIAQSVKQMGELLLTIKGTGQYNVDAQASEADVVLRPLMDLLDGKAFFRLLFFRWQTFSKL